MVTELELSALDFYYSAIPEPAQSNLSDHLFFPEQQYGKRNDPEIRRCAFKLNEQATATQNGHRVTL